MELLDWKNGSHCAAVVDRHGRQRSGSNPYAAVGRERSDGRVVSLDHPRGATVHDGWCGPLPGGGKTLVSVD